MMKETTERVRIDLNEFTLGDAEDFEEATGIPFKQVFEHRTPAVLAALYWLTERRNNPNATLEDARQIKMNELPDAS